MKKLILAAAGASLLAAPALAAPYGYHAAPVRQQAHSSYYQGYGNQNHQQQYQRNWKRGDRFDSRYARNYREIRNPRAYHLRDAPRGYRWVQSNNDAVLVAVASGVIGAILANMF
jgi:Ni/Co efflux regulator RcnB